MSHACTSSRVTYWWVFKLNTFILFPPPSLAPFSVYFYLSHTDTHTHTLANTHTYFLSVTACSLLSPGAISLSVNGVCEKPPPLSSWAPYITHNHPALQGLPATHYNSVCVCVCMCVCIHVCSDPHRRENPQDLMWEEITHAVTHDNIQRDPMFYSHDCMMGYHWQSTFHEMLNHRSPYLSSAHAVIFPSRGILTEN